MGVVSSGVIRTLCIMQTNAEYQPHSNPYHLHTYITIINTVECSIVAILDILLATDPPNKVIKGGWGHI